jgi:hypothetical protein
MIVHHVANDVGLLKVTADDVPTEAIRLVSGNRPDPPQDYKFAESHVVEDIVQNRQNDEMSGAPDGATD